MVDEAVLGAEQFDVGFLLFYSLRGIGGDIFITNKRV